MPDPDLSERVPVEVFGLRHDQPFCRLLEAWLYPLRDRWDELFEARPQVAVPLGEFTDSNQVGFSFAILLEKIVVLDRRPVRAVRSGTRLIVWDGTHRVAAARVRGDQEILAFVLEGGALPPELIRDSVVAIESAPEPEDPEVTRWREFFRTVSNN